MLFLRYEVDEDGVDEVVGAVEAAFEALHELQPEGVRYAYWRRAGGTEFVALLDLDEGVRNPLPDIEAARSLQKTVAERVRGNPATPLPLTVLGSYGFLLPTGGGST